MRPALVALCLFNVAAGCWLAAMEVVLRHPGFPSRILVAGLIVAQSASTLGAVGRSSTRAWRIVAAAGACVLFAFGATAFVKNEAGSDFEGYVAVIAVALMLQAVLTLRTMWHGSRFAAR